MLLTVGFLLGIIRFLAQDTDFQRRLVARGLMEQICCKSLVALSFACFKRPVTAETSLPIRDDSPAVYY